MNMFIQSMKQLKRFEKRFEKMEALFDDQFQGLQRPTIQLIDLFKEHNDQLVRVCQSPGIHIRRFDVLPDIK